MTGRFDPKATYVEYYGVRFSTHALLRVEERLAINAETLAKQLHDHKAVAIGTRGGKTHWLFWDLAQAKPFISIVDDDSRGARVVVTVLPWHFHERLAWVVDPNAVERAQALAEGTQEAEGLPPVDARAVSSGDGAAPRDSQPTTTNVSPAPRLPKRVQLRLLIEAESGTEKLLNAGACSCQSRDDVLQSSSTIRQVLAANERHRLRLGPLYRRPRGVVLIGNGASRIIEWEAVLLSAQTLDI